MGNRRRSQSISLKYAFIKTDRGEFDTAVMCRLLHVSRSGFYQWLLLGGPPSIRWLKASCWTLAATSKPSPATNSRGLAPDSRSHVLRHSYVGSNLFAWQHHSPLGREVLHLELELRSLKKERLKKRIYKTRKIATIEIRECIELFYNRIRRHSHLSRVSPEAFEAISMRT